ncbi:galactose-specific lectin nattectin-like [Vanacampus margaritifer]
MAFALRSLLLLCGISGLLTGVWSAANSAKGDKSVKVPSCPNGWTRLDDRCFYVVNQSRDFDDAELTCVAIGGNLASILSTVEHAVVLALVDYGTTPTQASWIGYNDIAADTVFVWTDGSTPGFEVFEGGAAPVNDAEDCVVTNTGTDTLFWDDEDCTTEIPFVCVTGLH